MGDAVGRQLCSGACRINSQTELRLYNFQHNQIGATLITFPQPWRHYNKGCLLIATITPSNFGDANWPCQETAKFSATMLLRSFDLLQRPFRTNYHWGCTYRPSI
jgi:hypothetical protein